MPKPSDRVSPIEPGKQGLMPDPYDFSVVLGGPLFQLLRRAYLCGDALELLRRRALVLGAKLPEFKIDLVLIVAVLLFAVLWPLLVFTPQLARAKRTGLREYGVLAQRYVREFDHKWLRGGAAADEPLVGSGDIQSLADLGNSFEVIRTMRVVPITKEAIVQLVIMTLAPVLPLTLTMLSVDELLGRLLAVVF